MGAENTSFLSLVIVVLVAFLTPIILHRLHLKMIPVIVGEIIAGLIIGHSGFDLIHNDMWIETLSTLGFIYLLFLSGLEIDFSVFAGHAKKETLPSGKKEPNGVLVALVVFAMVLVLSYLISLLFVWSGLIDNVYLMTLIISTISLGVVMPTLKDSGIMKTGIGQTILMITVIGDLATMVLLAIFLSVFSAEGASTWLLLVLFGAGLLLYFVGKYFRKQSFLETMSKGTIQLDIRAVFALIIVLVGLSEIIHTEIILGSFLAGVLVSLLSPDPVMVNKLDSFGYGFFIPIFFVMTGVDLNVWELFSHSSVLLLMPLLLVAFFTAKLIPTMWLRRWYGWRTTFSVGFLVSAKLTLVIAAVEVGGRLHIISGTMSSAIILVAVISCIIGPILFKKLFAEQQEHKKTKIAIIGANQMSLPVSLELDASEYETTIYHTSHEKLDHSRDGDRSFTVKELPDYKVDSLEGLGAYEVDLLVATTNDDRVNADIAIDAREYVERVIARIETADIREELRGREVEVFSSFFSTKTVLKAMIESPSVVDILTTEENGLFELEMQNQEFNGTPLRKFPYLGDTIIVRIFRDNNSIIPHGDTELQTGDQLIVTGTLSYVDNMREMLS